jgi:hypothetical protein
MRTIQGVIDCALRDGEITQDARNTLTLELSRMQTDAQLFRADPHIPALRKYLQDNGKALGIRPGEHYSAGLLRLLPDLIRDARRFAGIRAVLCEPSEEKRDRMYDAFEAIVPSSAMAKANVTPDEVNVVFDMLLSLCEQVRNANG